MMKLDKISAEAVKILGNDEQKKKSKFNDVTRIYAQLKHSPEIRDGSGIPDLLDQLKSLVRQKATAILDNPLEKWDGGMSRLLASISEQFIE